MINQTALLPIYAPRIFSTLARSPAFVVSSSKTNKKSRFRIGSGLSRHFHLGNPAIRVGSVVLRPRVSPGLLFSSFRFLADGRLPN